MKNTNYKKEFNDKVYDFQKIVNDSRKDPFDYGRIATKKYKTILEQHRIVDGWNENIIVVASLVPEWSQGLRNIQSEYAGTKTAATKEIEGKDFKRFYKLYPEKVIPKNKWQVPLTVKYELMDIYLPVSGKTKIKNKVSVIKTISFEEALNKYSVFRKSKVSKNTFSKSFLVEYVFVKKQINPIKAKKHPYWIYPKSYIAKISLKNKSKLNSGAFILKDGIYKNLSEQLAAVIKVEPVKVNDFTNYFQLDSAIKKFTSLSKVQKKAFTNYLWRQKNIYKKH